MRSVPFSGRPCCLSKVGKTLIEGNGHGHGGTGRREPKIHRSNPLEPPMAGPVEVKQLELDEASRAGDASLRLSCTLSCDVVGGEGPGGWNPGTLGPGTWDLRPSFFSEVYGPSPRGLRSSWFRKPKSDWDLSWRHALSLSLLLFFSRKPLWG